MAEEWRDVPGFEGTLIDSSLGRVAHIRGFDTGGYVGISVLADKGSHLVLTDNLTVNKDNGFVILAHRIVALTFLGPPPVGCNDINHEDGNKANNAVSNISWCTRKHNLEHARRTGLQTDPLRSYTEAQYRQARELREAGDNWPTIARKTGMNVGAAWHAVVRSQRGRSPHRPWREAE